MHEQGVIPNRVAGKYDIARVDGVGDDSERPGQMLRQWPSPGRDEIEAGCAPSRWPLTACAMKTLQVALEDGQAAILAGHLGARSTSTHEERVAM